MANTYTQLYVQFVFATQYRLAQIQPEWETELFKYITGIVKNNKHKLIVINGMPDHLHVFVGLNTTQSIADLMRMVKGESSEWINLKQFTPRKFNWQAGYGAFSYSHSQLDRVYHYISNQKKHHETKCFFEEYKELLQEFDIEFDERYLFKNLD